jgi:hypothetical protein
MVRHVWEALAAQEQRLIKDGQPLDTEEANLAELRAMAEQFERVQLPALQALGVA